MRSIITLCAVLLLYGLASGQAGFGHGHSAWTPPGLYSEPFTPLVTTPIVALDAVPTPSMSLDPVSPTAGASNATVGEAVVYAQPAWYSPLPIPEVQEATSSSQNEVSFQDIGFDSGAARFESSYGAAQFLKRPRASQSRLYTNSDVERVNQTNGLVKYAGRTARLG
jgi:hypothetical protein